jgi:hypothetical protein
VIVLIQPPLASIHDSEHNENTLLRQCSSSSSRKDARWNDERDAVEFSVFLRPYEGTVRVARGVFQGLSISDPPQSGASKHSIFSARSSR